MDNELLNCAYTICLSYKFSLYKCIIYENVSRTKFPTSTWCMYESRDHLKSKDIIQMTYFWNLTCFVGMTHMIAVETLICINGDNIS